jgi:hypothetical protein
VKRLTVSIPALFLCSALSAMTLTYAGHAGKPSKSNDGIEFRPRVSDECVIDMANFSSEDSCDSFSFTAWEKPQHIYMGLFKGEWLVGYLGRKLDPEDLNSDDRVLVEIFEQQGPGVILQFVPPLMPLPPYNVPEEFRGKLALSILPFYQSPLIDIYGDAFVYAPDNYSLKIQITTAKGVDYEHSWPVKLKYINDTKGIFKTNTADAKGSVIEPVPGTNAYKTEAYRLELIDSLGRMLKYVEGSGKPLTIEEVGAYFLRAREKNGRVAGSKGVVKTH